MTFAICMLAIGGILGAFTSFRIDKRVLALDDWAARFRAWLIDKLAENDRIQEGHTRMITRLMSYAKANEHTPARLRSVAKMVVRHKIDRDRALNVVADDINMLLVRVEALEKQNVVPPRFRLSVKRIDRDDSGPAHPVDDEGRPAK